MKVECTKVCQRLLEMIVWQNHCEFDGIKIVKDKWALALRCTVTALTLWPTEAPWMTGHWRLRGISFAHKVICTADLWRIEP